MTPTKTFARSHLFDTSEPPTIELGHEFLVQRRVLHVLKQRAKLKREIKQRNPKTPRLPSAGERFAHVGVRVHHTLRIESNAERKRRALARMKNPITMAFTFLPKETPVLDVKRLTLIKANGNSISFRRCKEKSSSKAAK